jgi:hypothetical protein
MSFTKSTFTLAAGGIAAGTDAGKMARNPASSGANTNEAGIELAQHILRFVTPEIQRPGGWAIACDISAEMAMSAR